MPKKENLIGLKFYKLTVLKEDPEDSQKVICQCECGNIKSIRKANLKNGGTKSCGCLHKSKVSQDLIGKRFGKLIVVEKTNKRTKNRSIIWKCKCDCGNYTEVSSRHLIQQNTFSCGCLKSSHGEFLIEKQLKKYNIKYKREFTFSDLISKKGGYLRFDFAIFNNNNELTHLIEFDGETHNLEYIAGWFTLEKLQNQLINDTLKDEYCKKNNIPLIRIKNINDINQIIESAFLV